MQHTPLLLSRLLDRGALVAPEAEIVTATVSGTHRQTYKQTRDRSHQLAHALVKAGIKIGDTIGTFMWNGSKHLEAFHAISCMGAILHPLNVRLSEQDLIYIINHAEDRLLIVDADLLPRLEKIVNDIPTVERVIVAPSEGFENWTTSLPNPIDFDEFIAGQPTEFQWPIIEENSTYGLCYTSGTTGHPKGVAYEHRAQYLHTLTICMTDILTLSATDSILGFVPMFHAMGWGIPWAALMLGAKQVFPHRFMKPERLCQLIAEEEVTIAFGVPTIWQEIKEILLQNPHKYDFSPAERFACSGTAPPVSLCQWYYENHGIELIQGYGLTETSPISSISRMKMKYKDRNLPIAEQLKHLTKAGITLPGIEAKVVNSQLEFLDHDDKTEGEILLRGPWITDRYYKLSKPDSFYQDWLRTGDIGTIDRDRYLKITDRGKDLIKSGGEWISSSDLESAITGIDGVFEACVVAQPHPKWDERPVALVVLKKSKQLTAELIKGECLKTFAKWQIPDDIIFVDSIPLNSTGKMDKKLIKQQLKEQGYRLPDLRSNLKTTS